jgi:hypothetical protein
MSESGGRGNAMLKNSHETTLDKRSHEVNLNIRKYKAKLGQEEGE